MANYEVSPALLERHVPYGTELDIWNGVCYVSLVGFLFRNTRVRGIRVPWHTTFEEVNLRFYVRYRSDDEWRRGVVFIREIVPRRAIAEVANRLYRENYRAMPMRHEWVESPDRLEVTYGWKLGRWHTLGVTAENRPVPILPGSEEEFITEHYWGYAFWDDRTTNQYQVVHPRWEVYPVIDYRVDLDPGLIYGEEWAGLTDREPTSIFLAEGSEVAVLAGERVR